MKEELYILQKRHRLPIAVILLLSVGFILLFSKSTSPLSYYYNGNDSSIPVTIARGWYYHIIPYKDFFTSNGPWMYWISKIGIAFVHGNKCGIIITQIINLFLFLLSVYFITQLVTHNKIYACTVLCITTVLLKTNYPDGMYSEEFLLPWIGWSYYFILRYFDKHSIHSLHSLFFGITLGITIMCNTAGLIALVPTLFIYIHLIITKQWKYLLFNLLLLCIGIGIIVIPFILYFQHQGCLDSMIYDVFQYHSDTFFHTTKTSYYYKTIISLRITVFISFLSCLLSLFKKKYMNSLIYVCIGLLESYYFFQMDFSTNLSMFCIINIPLLCNSIFELFPSKNHPKTTTILCLTLSFIFLYRFYDKDIQRSIYSIQQYSIYNNQGWEGLLENIPSEDYDKLVIYGSKKMNNAYLLSNAMPCYKYFYLQDEISNQDDSLKKDMIQTFQTTLAKWILCDNHTETIQDILDSDYECIDHTSIYSLYERK